MIDREIRGGTESVATLAPKTITVPKLVAVTGPSSGRALAVTKATSTIGRHRTNDLVLDDPRVSGAHLEVTPSGTGVLVRDVGSTNGTWIGPHRIFEAEIATGGVLTLGESTIRIEVDANVVAPPVGRDSFEQLVGRSPPMRELFATLERIAPKDLSVLIQGETGSGKEEIARAVHAASPRRKGPFVVIDATALPEALAESLLFGHEKGAFTGALERRIGFFEAAHGGTVLIDEVGELPLGLQSKFLRVLERGEIVRVGSNNPIPIDIRVLSATNRDLRNAIDRGQFREDLYFRLAQVRAFVPPLRQRADDLQLLCANLLARAQSDAMIDVDALEYLASRPWPGNVRELRNVLLRAAALAREGIIRKADVAGEGEGFRGASPDERSPLDLTGTFGEAKERAIDRFERAYLSLLMKRCNGNLSAAAREATMARHYLRDLLKKRGLYGPSRDDD